MKNNIFKLVGFLLGWCVIVMTTKYLLSPIPDGTFKDYLYWTGILFILGASIIFALNLIFPNTFNDNQNSNSNSDDLTKGDILYRYGDYHNGFSLVERIEVLDELKRTVRSTFAYADETGEIVTKWYVAALQYEDPGYALVYDGSMYNILGKDGKELSVMWFYSIGDEVTDNKMKVYWNDGTVNFIDVTTGKLLWKEWKKSL